MKFDSLPCAREAKRTAGLCIHYYFTYFIISERLSVVLRSSHYVVDDLMNPGCTTNVGSPASFETGTQLSHL